MQIATLAGVKLRVEPRRPLERSQEDRATGMFAPADPATILELPPRTFAPSKYCRVTARMAHGRAYACPFARLFCIRLRRRSRPIARLLLPSSLGLRLAAPAAPLEPRREALSRAADRGADLRTRRHAAHGRVETSRRH